jgi:hypothetical protein
VIGLCIAHACNAHTGLADEAVVANQRKVAIIRYGSLQATYLPVPVVPVLDAYVLLVPVPVPVPLLVFGYF